MRRAITTRGLVSAFSLSALLFVPFGLWSFGIQPPGVARAAAPPPPIAVIQGLSDLATSRVHVSDFIEGANAHYQGKWFLHGEVIVGVDLSAATYVRSQPETREAVLRLPQPHVISSKIDHDRSDELYVRAKAWVPTSSPKALRDEVWKQAARKIQKLGQDAAYREQARAQAQRVLEKLFQDAGWKVRFEWAG